MADLKYGSTKCDTTRYILDKRQRDVQEFHRKQALELIKHKPSGTNAFQPNLVRGNGAHEPQGCLYAKGWTRRTVEGLQKLHDDGIPLYVETGQRSIRGRDYKRTWVMIKQRAEHFDKQLMEQYVNLWFAADVASANAY